MRWSSLSKEQLPVEPRGLRVEIVYLLAECENSVSLVTGKWGKCYEKSFGVYVDNYKSRGMPRKRWIEYVRDDMVRKGVMAEMDKKDTLRRPYTYM